MNISKIIANILRTIQGETAAGTIVRKQERIAVVAQVEGQKINEIVKTELTGVRSLAQAALARIDALAGTGALDTETRRAVEKMRTSLGVAQAAL